MAKKRACKSASLRGPTAFQSRIMIRRVSVDLSEAVWGRLKCVGVQSQLPINRLIEEACLKVYGKSSESELVALYRAIAGEEGVDLKVPVLPKFKPEAAATVQPETNPYASFVIEAATSVSPSGFEANQPVPKAEPPPARLDGEHLKCSKDTIQTISDLLGL